MTPRKIFSYPYPGVSSPPTEAWMQANVLIGDPGFAVNTGEL